MASAASLSPVASALSTTDPTDATSPPGLQAVPLTKQSETRCLVEKLPQVGRKVPVKIEDSRIQDELLNVLETVPKDIRRNLVDLQYVDVTFREMNRSLCTKRREYLHRMSLATNARSAAEQAENERRRADVDRAFVVALRKCEQKEKITKQTCELISRHIAKLDSHLKLLGESDVPTEDVTVSDEDQRRYCICNTPSFGEMIACDNSNCPTEWFHYSCVGITEAPSSKWYCADCLIKRNEEEQKFGILTHRSGLGIRYPGYTLPKVQAPAAVACEDAPQDMVIPGMSPYSPLTFDEIPTWTPPGSPSPPPEEILLALQRLRGTKRPRLGEWPMVAGEE